MSTASPFKERVNVEDFARRLSRLPRHAIGTADPGMVAQPYADPGYAMPNADIGNLNQAPAQEVSGWLPAAAQGSGLLNLTDDQLNNLFGLSR